MTSTFVGGVWTASGAIANVNTLLAGVTFTPALNFNSNFTIATSVTDGVAPAITGVKAMTGTPVDDSFTDANEAVSVLEDSGANVGNVLTGTSSVDGPVSVTQFLVAGDVTVYAAGSTATIAGVGTLQIAANGAYTFTPAANYNGPVPVVTYTVTDGSGTDDTSTLTLTVTPVDDSFTDANEAVSVLEDSGANVGNVLTGTSSVDGPVSVTQFLVAGDVTVYAAGSTATIAGVGTLQIAANGAYTFTPAANYNGPVPVVTYTVTDGSGTDDTSTLTLTVTPVDDSFTDANEAVSVLEDSGANVGNVLTGTSSVDGPVSVTQFLVAGDVTVYAAGSTATIAGVGTLQIAANGAYTFTPAANYNGPVPVVTYTVTDGSGTDDTSTLTLTVTPVDDSFTDADEAVSVLEDSGANVGNVLTGTSSVDGPVSVTQFLVAGDVTVYAAGSTATIAGVGTLQIAANGAYTFTPAANYNGPVPVVTYTVTDGSGTDDTSTLTLTVTPVDDSFTDADEAVSVLEDSGANVGNVLTGTSSVDGPVSVTQFLVAGDVTVYAAGSTATIAGVGTLQIAANGAYTFTPAANYNGPVPVVTYTVTDGSGTDDTSTLTLTVTPVDDSFTDADEAVSVLEDSGANLGNVLTGTSSVDGPVSVTQFLVAGDVTVYAAGSTATIAGVGTLQIAANGAYTFTPAANYNGPVPVVTYTVTDGSGTDDTSTLTLTVTPVNDLPVNTVPGPQTVTEDTALALGGISVTDVEGIATVQLGVLNGTVTVTLSGGAVISGGANGTGTLTLAGSQAAINATLASLVYQGTLNYNGPDTLTVTTTDTNSATDVDTVALTVTPAPNIVPSLTTNAGSTVVQGLTDFITLGELQVTDADNTPAQLIYTVTVGPVNGQLELTTAPGVAIVSFTQADIDAGRLVYRQQRSQQHE